MGQVRRALEETAARGGASSRNAIGSVLQLPKVVARSKHDGVVVTLRNDTSDRRIVIDPEKSRIVVQYWTVSSGLRVREVSPAAGTLAPGEAAEALFIPLEGNWESVRVGFEHRDRDGVHGTHVTVP